MALPQLLVLVAQATLSLANSSLLHWGYVVDNPTITNLIGLHRIHGWRGMAGDNSSRLILALMRFNGDSSSRRAVCCILAFCVQLSAETLCQPYLSEYLAGRGELVCCLRTVAVVEVKELRLFWGQSPPRRLAAFIFAGGAIDLLANSQ